ncbi:hypothetical protein LTR10_020693 [Elasticomyces elasticus]|uniref:Exostosin GT47 domain-containing protein n=1 Tax=Exophiala sideris TaxID=1016849 RepID=A0ABR0JHG8_9EURO|nr:hypothetical protein LTR10_020693 [Elasticomyces elasticus]KAK5033560.1 hypothetical protein LTS07_003865 [Exophiala sideris]KAK5041945.1 hypothetical protein LTR13_001750 [Exophiala sideris]KAK5064104.1 hypothetical protein LTR69_003873 [Exophiala sideris]KAK5185213.1 hypothetical protein LTR44_002201 [Eurotiomycetes sp. CCFEE 6388]
MSGILSYVFSHYTGCAILSSTLFCRLHSFIWVFTSIPFFLLFIFSSNLDHDHLSTTLSSWQLNTTRNLRFPGHTVPLPDPLRVWIIESTGSHDEVRAALVHSFGGLDHGEITMFRLMDRFDIHDIMDNFTMEAPVKSIRGSQVFEHAMHELPLPHVVVSTTCEADLNELAEPMHYLLANSSAHLFCTIHHADHWVKGRHVEVAREWVEKGRIDFLGLSKHTVDYFVRKVATQWDSRTPFKARAYPPLFPVQLPESEAGTVDLAMQGDYSPSRRNYRSIFKGLGQVVSKVEEYGQNETVALRLLGHGKKPLVPARIKNHVVFDEGLSYPDFYSRLSSSFAVLPAFASSDYLDRKASSTIPAALIAGAPVLADEQLLASYTYLPKEAVWMMKPGETEMMAMARLVGHRDEYRRKREACRMAAKDLMEENRRNVRKWVTEASWKSKWVENP